MRSLLYAPAKSSALGPSSALSLLAHAAFIGAALYGSGLRARELQEELAQRVYFLVPPDRRPSTESSRERLQYIEVGAGATAATKLAPTGTVAAPARADAHDGFAGNPGRDVAAETASSPFVSQDSTYSVLDVEESATRAVESAAPSYPAQMIRDGREGNVRMRYVVDTTGRVDLAASEVLRSTDPAFTLAVRDALPGMRFSPAMVQGRRVRQLVEQDFAFHLNIPAPVFAEQTRTSPPKP